MFKDTFNILFTCIGRRVSLLESFRRAARQLKINACFVGTDTNELSSALQLCDKSFLVPTVDLDLKLLSQNRAKFSALGCFVLVSRPQVIDICQDKRKTYRFLIENGFDTPLTVSIRSALSSLVARRSSLVAHPSCLKVKSLHFPCFLKPWDGYASKGNAIAKNRQELLFFAKRIPNAICQEFIKGAEYTCDVYVDFNMKVRCVVPRKRIETRAGEVSKGQIDKQRCIMNESARLVEALQAGPGVITLQLFLTPDGKIKFIEINPRFAGGVPLSIKAGANFPKWIFQELFGVKPNIRFDGFKDGFVMLRYDSEVWLTGI
jgi:carbamoyl-phosphate synthase large subunit